MPVIIDGTLGVNAAAVTTTSWNPTNLVIPGNATIGDSSSDTLTINGSSITLAGNATRFKADFSNDTIENQCLFQTTGVNYSTQLRTIPNGTGGQTGFFFYGKSDINNSSWGAIRTIDGLDVRIQSYATGTGAILPITFMVGTTERMRIDANGKLRIDANSTTPAPGDTTNAKLVVSSSSTAPGDIMLVRGANSQVTQPTAYASGGDHARLSFYQGDSAVNYQRYLDLVSDGSGGSASSNIRMYTNSGSAAPVERLRIDFSGNVGIGTTSPLNGVGINLTLSQSLALGVTSTTTGDIISSGGGNSTTYNGVAIISNARSLSGSANSAIASWIVDVGGRAADGTTFNVNKSDTFSVSRKLGAGNFYGSSEFLRINSAGNVGVSNSSPEFKVDIGNSTIPFRHVTTNPTGHAISSGYLETRNMGISIGNGESAWITKDAVTANKWFIKLTGIWENNYEGGGLTPPAAEVYVSAAYPWVNVGSLAIEIQRDSSSGRLRMANNSGYAVHFTGEISVIESPQSSMPAYSGNHIALNLSGYGSYSGMVGGLVLSTPCYSEYQFRWYGMASHTTTLTCASYQMSEIIYTTHQSNGGTDNNEYVRGKWSNNHDSHIWTEFEHSGNIGAMTTSFTVSQNDVYNSGKLIIQETYSNDGQSYSFSNLIIRTYYGGWNISHT